MGAIERSSSDLEADRFFAGFVNASPELIAAIETERGGDRVAPLAATALEAATERAVEELLLT